MTLYDEFQKETGHLRMSDAEKSAMRMRLEAAMAGAPRAPRPTPSPYSFMWAPRSFALLGLALLLVVSTGTAYAAEGSLPGAPLYPVKVNVIEPLAVALASGPAAKAQVHADLAVRRVAEAQTLAAKGDLTVRTAQEIADNYNAHAEAAIVLARNSDAADPTAVLDATASTSAEVAMAPAPTSTEPSDQPPVAARSALTMTMTMVAEPETPTTSNRAATTTPAVSKKRGLAGKLHAALSAEATILTNLNKKIRRESEKGDTPGVTRQGKQHATTTEDIKDVTVPHVLELEL